MYDDRDNYIRNKPYGFSDRDRDYDRREGGERRLRSEQSDRARSNGVKGFFGGAKSNMQPLPRSNDGSNVVIYSPKTFDDVQTLIDYLKRREQVIVDFAGIDQTAVYRIMDFMSGAIYALNGSIQQITSNIFLFAPAGVTITVPPQFKGKR